MFVSAVKMVNVIVSIAGDDAADDDSDGCDQWQICGCYDRP